jgi:nicotinate-nucleotide adenylyltransferase
MHNAVPTPRSARRIAFFGGSFDPPHRGHLAIAHAAQRALALDGVLFAPVGTQPLKPEGSSASFAQRVAMTQLAIADDQDFAVSLVDAPSASGRPNYTIDTLAQLHAELGPETELFCLMGMDSFLNLPLWHRAAALPFAATLVVAARPGESLDAAMSHLPDGLTAETPTLPASTLHGIAVLQYTLRNTQGLRAPLYLLPSLYVEISATEIRSLLLGGGASEKRLKTLVPPAVADYLKEHGLYQ